MVRCLGASKPVAARSETRCDVAPPPSSPSAHVHRAPLFTHAHHARDGEPLHGTERLARRGAEPRATFTRLAKASHGRRGAGAAAHFERMMEAFEVLRDARTRAAYDAALRGDDGGW